MDRIKISVVIPSYNKCSVLSKTIQALEEQTWSLMDFEVIIVDDGSSDGTIEWLNHQKLPIQTKIFHQDNLGAGAARNLGAKEARGELLLFLDADIIASSNLLYTHWNAHQLHPQSLIMGRIQQWNVKSVSPSYDIFARVVYDMGNKERNLPYTLNLTQNLSINASDFANLGGFDEEIHRGQDIELGFRAVQNGFNIHYIPDALAFHNDPINIDQLTHKTRHDYRQLVILFKKYPHILKDLDYLEDKLPVDWKRDSPGLKMRKLVRQIHAGCLFRIANIHVCKIFERYWPHQSLLKFLIWKIVGSYQLLGLRDGMRQYGWKP